VVTCESDDEFSISTLLEKANNLDEPLVIFGDIAVPTGLQNADPCTARGCLWPKNNNGRVFVPYRISNQYSRRERDVIEQGLKSFEAATCISFRPQSRERDFLNIQSRDGCYSFVGRRGGGQIVSLSRQGCVFHQIVQHEVLHALGFDHEQTRSDRDQHVRILLENVIPGMEHNFRKIDTRNLDTSYDYNSVMHYGRFAFSKNREPTIIPIPNENVAIGRATEMSGNDILRVNRLYNCSMYLVSFLFFFFLLKKKGSWINSWKVSGSILGYSNLNSIQFNSSIHSLPLILSRVAGGAGAYPSCHRARGRVHPGQVASLSQGQHTGTDNHSRSHSLTPSDNLDYPINLSPQTACLWTVGGSRSTRREPTQTRGEHANSTQKDPGLMVELNSGPSCCAATVLTTVPPCCLIQFNFIFIASNHKNSGLKALYIVR
uniref:Metalloendopeptidase n=1 Tax=Oreochromis niloticus TaxID=8128 RepID=A0A669DAA6_ORENI